MASLLCRPELFADTGQAEASAAEYREGSEQKPIMGSSEMVVMDLMRILEEDTIGNFARLSKHKWGERPGSEWTMTLN